MKKYLKILGFAVLIGGVIAFLFYQDINREVKAITKKDGVVKIFQVGVFKTLDNANNFANTFPSSYIYKTDDYYRVIIAVCYLEDACQKLETFYQNQGIDYYLKEVRLSKSFIEKLDNYEKIIVKSTKAEVINNINNNVLILFDSYNK